MDRHSHRWCVPRRDHRRAFSALCKPSLVTTDQTVDLGKEFAVIAVALSIVQIYIGYVQAVIAKRQDEQLTRRAELWVYGTPFRLGQVRITFRLM